MQYYSLGDGRRQVRHINNNISSAVHVSLVVVANGLYSLGMYEVHVHVSCFIHNRMLSATELSKASAGSSKESYTGGALNCPPRHRNFEARG